MNWIPDRLRLEHGAVFRMTHQFKDEGEKYRYFIVLNQSPASDKLIILTTTTTQRERLERLYRSEAQPPLVYIHPSDYPDVEQFCMVDCRAVSCWEKEDLLLAIKEQQSEFKTHLPDKILKDITTAISRDKTIPSSIKSLIIGPSE